VLGGGEVVSIVAVVVTACATVGGAVASARISGWRDDRDRERKAKEAGAQRHEELVETAADAVTNALYAFEQRRVSNADNATPRGELFDDKVRSVGLVATRVALHFPRGHAATTAYEDAHKGLNDLRKLVFEEKQENLGADFADDEANEVRGALKRFQDAAREWPPSPADGI